MHISAAAKVSYRSFLLLLLALAFLFFYSSQKVKAIDKLVASAAGTHSEILQGIVSQNELVDNLERLGIHCVFQEGFSNSLLVEKVQLGSSAYYGGIKVGDIIMDLHKINTNVFSLSIKRSGKLYQIGLSILSGKLDEDFLKTGIKNDLLQASAIHQDLSGEINKKQQTISGSAQATIIPGSINERNNESAKKLLPYDIELVIDITGSMDWYDGTGDLTKFQWCHNQVSSLAQKLAPYHKTFAITTFNTAHATIENCNPEIVEHIYASTQPSGNTDLVDPLMDRLNNAYLKHLSNGHPVLIVVITDGLPNVPRNPRLVNRALIDFTQRMADQDDVVVTILQIGDTFEGRDFCIDLDDNLINEGAKYDIVDTKTFAELKNEGLVNAMIDAAVEARNNKHLSKQEKHLKRFVKSLPLPSAKVRDIDFKLKEKQSERQAIEQQLLSQ